MTNLQPISPLPDERKGLASLEAALPLFPVLMLLQQHRGLSAAWFAGETSFALRMAERAQCVDAVLRDYSDPFRAPAIVSARIVTADEAGAFAQHWQRVRARDSGLTATQNFAYHSAMIGELLGWLRRARVQSSDAPCASGAMRGLVHNLLIRLPRLSELLSQVRGLGVAVVAYRASQPQLRANLACNLVRAESLLREIDRTFPAAESVGRAVDQLAWTIRTEVIARNRVRLSPAGYFDLASQAIDGVFGAIEQGQQALGLVAAEERPC